MQRTTSGSDDRLLAALAAGFSHDNPLVVCTDGQQPADVTQSKGGCQRQAS
jgi:hypothetical protein